MPMRAVAFDAIGATPELTELPAPEPEAGEVLVRVQAASVNGFDLATIGGVFQGMFEYKFPVVLGKDFAGVVEAVGDGVTRFTPGDAVFGVVAKPVLADGGFAEYVVVPEQSPLAAVPEGLDTPQAAAIGLAAVAALNAVDAVAPVAGETVLIAGATGGVGAYAIQLAAERGAAVIATAKPGAEAEFVQDLGAAHVVDYTADLAEQVRAIAPDGVAAAIHLAGDGEPVAELLASEGRLASTLGFAPGPFASAVMAMPDPPTLVRLATAAADGKLRVPITRSYPLAEAPQAIADFAGGALGKLSIVID